MILSIPLWFFLNNVLVFWLGLLMLNFQFAISSLYPKYSIEVYLQGCSQSAFTYSNSIMYTRTKSEICSKLTIMTPEKTSSVFIFVLWTIFTYGSVVSIFAFEQVTTNGCDYFSEVSLWSWSEHYFKIHRKTAESQSFSIKLQPFSLQFY